MSMGFKEIDADDDMRSFPLNPSRSFSHSHLPSSVNLKVSGSISSCLVYC
ncbi:hypothetical protein LINGRAHAP2_LOCUS23164 [Linum grandiflorum]